jgi:hypothetical protein
MAQGGNNSFQFSTIAGGIPQILVAVNVVAMWEDKFGPIPGAVTLADKIAYIKLVGDSIITKTYAYGQCPIGYKIKSARYNTSTGGYSSYDLGTDYVGGNYNNDSSPSLLTQTSTVDALYANGMLYRLLYTDAAKQLVNEVAYDPATCAEWTIMGTGTTKGSSGIHLVEQSSTEYANINTVCKISTKYGILYNVTACTLDNEFDLSSSSMMGVTTALPKNIGNNKAIITTPSTISNNYFRVVCHSANTEGTYIDFKDVRLIELPTNSEIEKDFNTMTADQLAAKYPFGALPVASSTIYIDSVSVDLTCKAPTGYIALVSPTPKRDAGQSNVLFMDTVNNIVTEMYTGNSVELESLASGKVPAYLVELSMQAVSDSPLYGGSNASLKGAFKITSYADLYCMGQGALSGSMGFGAKVKGYTTSWQDLGNNTGTVIAKVNSVLNNSAYIQSNNKIYLLVCSQYGSDGTIPSSLSLDTISIKVQLTRTPDVAEALPVYLPQHWAMVVQGFSPCWDSSYTAKNFMRVFKLYRDANNFIRLQNTGNAFYIASKSNGISISSLTSSAKTFARHTVIGFMVVQHSGGKDLYIMLNNGTIEKLSNSNTNLLTGVFNLYLLMDNERLDYNADAFASRFALIDLERMGWQNGIPDATAEQILRGTYQGLQFPVMTGTKQLFPNNKYTVIGQGDLYIDAYKTRTVTTGDVVLTDRENKIILTDGSTIQLKM